MFDLIVRVVTALDNIFRSRNGTNRALTYEEWIIKPIPSDNDACHQFLTKRQDKQREWGLSNVYMMTDIWRSALHIGMVRIHNRVVPQRAPTIRRLTPQAGHFGFV